MRVISTVISAIALVSTVGFSMTAVAKQSVNFEITPMVGYRFGGDFDTSRDKVHHRIELSEETSYGLIAGWDVDRKRQGEFLVSHYDSMFSESDDFSASNTGLSVTYAHIGGTVPISDGFVPFFVTGGFGLSHLSPEDTNLDDETRFSMNLGLASKIMLTEHIGLRLDGRVYGTFFSENSALFCDIDTCAVYLSGEMWFQSEVSAGLTFRF